MTIATIASRMLTGMFAAFVFLACDQSADRTTDAKAAPSSTQATQQRVAPQAGLLHGRITMENGAVHEGRLRWGGDEEALWSNYFNGVKKGNAWAAFTSQKRDLGRPFMARFGDIARIEPRGRDIQVILKSGTVFHLNRYSADDLADGVRVWDDRGAFVDLGEWNIRSIEFLPASEPNADSSPLQGTVRTRAGDFTGLVQWNRQACLGADILEGTSAGGKRTLRFDTIKSIARRSPDSSLVTLLDGGEILMSGGMRENSGLYVDDERYGRVLISWEAFERVDFSPGGVSPAYSDYLPGRPLAGDVFTRSGRRLGGRLVFDLDESETTETLDAPSQGVDFTLPFSLIASIVPGEAGAPRASVTLLTGEVLQLERRGDLGERNAGILVFVEGSARPEHVPWGDVERIAFERRR